nr:ABC transporter G family member 24-like [Ipomoea batatas]
MPPSISAFTGAVFAACLLVKLAHSQSFEDIGGGTSASVDNLAVQELLTQEVYSRIRNVTSLALRSELAEKSSFCILNIEEDWNNAFNFTQNLSFVSSCVVKTRGDVPQRLCTAAEIRFYFSNTFMKSGSSSYLNPNRNCNLTSWEPGCEPGWACSTGSNQNLDLRNSQDIPARITDCQPCCEGFFCPHGITCMIPCPLGSYCPLATLNKTTGVCEPYSYQLPPGHPNHTCGGANIWADVRRSSEVFCSAGSYCPSNTEKIPCGSGY